MAFGISAAAIQALLASGQGLGGASAVGAAGGLGTAGATGALGAGFSSPTGAAGGLGAELIPPGVGATTLGAKAGPVTAKAQSGVTLAEGAKAKNAKEAFNSGVWADAVVALNTITQRKATETPRPQSFSGIGQPTPPRAQGQVFAPSPQQQQQPVPGLGQFLV